MKGSRASRAPAALAVVAATTLLPSLASAAGFEIGENTALANARGGTGVVSKSDPSATYFNPARLPYARGLQFKLDTTVIDLRLDFQRDPLVLSNGRVQEFAPASNDAPPFPVPYFAASWDLGSENLTAGITVQGPHGYGRRCMTEFDGGECAVDFENGARHMIVATNILEVYFLAAVGYRLQLAAGDLNFGLAAGPAWQRTDLTLVIDQLGLNVGPPYTEDPRSQGVFNGTNLQDWQATGIAGVHWQSKDGLRLGASYRPPIKWSSEGQLDIEFPESIRELVRLEGDGLSMRTNQAGSLRLGAGHATGTHPGRADAPRFDVEFNLVWENWSFVDAIETAPQGHLVLAEVQDSELNPVVQPKSYQDTFALRLGSSFGALPWLTLHFGTFFETAAQSVPFTNADFVSWERYSGSTGATLHLLDWLDVELSYASIFSPSRRVSQGAVYNQIPLSQCTYPDYDQAACPSPGVPPGNPQNEGRWTSHFQIAGLGLTFKLD